MKKQNWIKSSINWNRDPNVISIVEDIMKQVEKQNETIMSLIQNHAEELRASKDKIFELELRLKNYEEGYSPPNSIRITNNVKNEHSQSNTRWVAGWNNPNKAKNQQRNKASALEEEEEVVEEIGIEGARKWSRNWKQQRYVELCKKSDRKKEAAKKRIEDAKAKGEQDPLFVKHRCTWEEQPEHTRVQCPGRGFDMVFWNPNKIWKPYGKVLIKDLEF